MLTSVLRNLAPADTRLSRHNGLTPPKKRFPSGPLLEPSSGAPRVNPTVVLTMQLLALLA